MKNLFSSRITAFAIALILGVVIRHEHVSALSLVGAAICLLGAAIIRNPEQMFQGFQKFQMFQKLGSAIGSK